VREVDRAATVREGACRLPEIQLLGMSGSGIGTFRPYTGRIEDGQYRIDRLLEQYGPDIAMPDLRHELGGQASRA
jgi:hypothetical protein